MLIISALLQFTAQSTRPDFRTEDLFTGGPQPAVINGSAASISLDGSIRSDVAALLAQKVLATTMPPAERAGSNKLAQDATVAALYVSPVNPRMWLTLGLLKAQLNEAAAPAFKTSYLTGPLSRDAIIVRIQAVTAGDAVKDEEVRLLAQSDVRTILTKYSNLQATLAAVYRQASPDGKAFLLEAARTIDPRFSRQLQ